MMKHVIFLYNLYNRTLSNWTYEFDKWAPSVVKISYKVWFAFYMTVELKEWELEAVFPLSLQAFKLFAHQVLSYVSGT